MSTILSLEEWGYRMHAGEIYISKSSLSPDRFDLKHCVGDEDATCIAGPTGSEVEKVGNMNIEEYESSDLHGQNMWTVPPRYRLWELFFAHRDYFWRLGLCVPGGDPTDWWREKYTHHGEFEDEL